MATHYPLKQGHTKPSVGKSYSRFRNYYYSFKLKLYDPRTGMCKLEGWNNTIWISETDLSNWFIIDNDKV